MEKVKIQTKLNTSYILIFVSILVLVLPFSLHDNSDSVEPKLIDDSSIGYYQSTTCEISLSEVVIKNINNLENVRFNANNYAGSECFGKVTGLDKVGNSFFVSIGTNSLYSFVLQSIIWVVVLVLISKKRIQKKNYSYIATLFLPILFCSQLIFESRFYSNSNIYYDSSISRQNYYLISYFLGFLLISLVMKEIFEKREVSFANLIPLTFFFFGTYQGMNLNFFFVLLIFFGLQSTFKNVKLNKFTLVYFFFSIAWVLNKKTSDNFFDTDKLRGLINSSNDLNSTIYWIICTYFLLIGIYELVENSDWKNEAKRFSDMLLLSGSLIVVFGIFSSLNQVANFVFSFMLGQNKRGMRSLDSIDGNTWRGMLPSAELGGEFYGIAILLTIYLVLKQETNLNFFRIMALFICSYGMLRSNNFAAFSTLIIFGLSMFFQIYSKTFRNYKYLFFTIIAFCILFLLIFNVGSYETFNVVIIEEALIHSDLFPNDEIYESFLKKERYFIEKDFKTLILNSDNYQGASTSILFLIDVYTPKFNIPFLPNLVGLLGFLSLAINRTELWGIFIAKYSPSTIDTLFGYGPFQFSNYLYGHNIRLDLPKGKLSSLILPHSSFLDLIIFIGFGGIILLFLFVLFQIYKGTYDKSFSLALFLYMSINLIKSDSILYFPTFTLFSFLFIKSFMVRNE